MKIDIVSSLQDSMLHVEIKNIINADCQYAYYLFKNNVHIDTIWYSKSIFADFKLHETGLYYAACFIKNEESLYIEKTKIIQFMFANDYSSKDTARRISVNIFGSCVPRDIFEFDNDKKFKIGVYIARQSVVSAVSLPLRCKLEDISLNSSFQKKQVYNDITKSTFDLLKKNPSDYIIIDLIDERFPLAQYNGTFITFSNEIASSGFLIERNLVNKEKKNGTYEINGINLKDYIRIFCERISSIYNQEKIIIHKAKMLDYYIDEDKTVKKFEKNQLQYNKRVNDLYDFMYQSLIDEIPKAIIIDICDSFCADSRHKWGLAPMHYQKEYYLSVLNKLSSKICL